MPKSKKPVNAGLLNTEPTSTHKALAEFINETVGVHIGSDQVALVQRAYPLYLKSPAVEAQKAAERAEKERQAAEREAKRKAALKERLERIEADRARLLGQLGATKAELALITGGGDAASVPALTDPDVADYVETSDDEPEVEEAPEIVVAEADDEFVQQDDADEDDADEDFEPEGDDDSDEDF